MLSIINMTTGSLLNPEDNVKYKLALLHVRNVMENGTRKLNFEIIRERCLHVTQTLRCLAVPGACHGPLPMDFEFYRLF